jgi:hypothetical protein
MMENPGAQQRFDEKEFALILRRAAELQERDATHAPRSGMTLREIETIAAEAGIDPRHVRLAVQNLSSHEPTLWRKVAGPPASIHAQRTVAGEFDADALASLVDAAQAELGRPGTARDVLGGLEWMAKDSFGPVHVTARPRGGETRIQVSTDRKETAAVLLSLLPIAGMIGGGVAGSVLVPVPEIVAAGMGLVAGVGAARVIWQTVVDRWQRRVRVILDRVASAAETARTEKSLP